MDVDRELPLRNIAAPSRRLQWSHVLMDVDRQFFGNLESCFLYASMEPRPDGRG